VLRACFDCRERTAPLETVQVDVSDHVGVLTVSRPKALNALSATVVAELHTALDELATLVPDSTLRCLIVTGAGEKSFVAGADIAGMVGMSVADAASYAAATHAAFEKIELFPVPVSQPLPVARSPLHLPVHLHSGGVPLPRAGPGCRQWVRSWGRLRVGDVM
jgi:1,4-dihydroxy-2-naphthoyl-CoA synthase